MEKKEMKKVMIRTYSAGVHFGYLAHKEYTPAGVVVILEKAQRIYSWEGANTLSDLSTVGSSNIQACKISMPVKHIELVAIEIIDMTDEAYENLTSNTYWKVTNMSDEEIDKLISVE